MKKLLIAIIMILITGVAYAQEAWYEAAEACAVDYEISVSRQIPTQGVTKKDISKSELNTIEKVASEMNISRLQLMDQVRQIQIENPSLSIAATIQSICKQFNYVNDAVWAEVANLAAQESLEKQNEIYEEASNQMNEYYRNPDNIVSKESIEGGCGGGTRTTYKNGDSISLVCICLAEDTPIVTNKGIKKISEIKKGDMVLGKDGYKEVLLVSESEGSPNFRINGIETTGLHPFIMENGELIKAKNLKIGDKLLGGIEVEEVTKISSTKKVYDLDVDGGIYHAGNIPVHSGVRLDMAKWLKDEIK